MLIITTDKSTENSDTEIARQMRNNRENAYTSTGVYHARVSEHVPERQKSDSVTSVLFMKRTVLCLARGSGESVGSSHVVYIQIWLVVESYKKFTAKVYILNTAALF
jgi:hypothetical protein